MNDAGLDGPAGRQEGRAPGRAADRGDDRAGLGRDPLDEYRAGEPAPHVAGADADLRERERRAAAHAGDAAGAVDRLARAGDHRDRERPDVGDVARAVAHAQPPHERPDPPERVRHPAAPGDGRAVGEVPRGGREVDARRRGGRAGVRRWRGVEHGRVAAPHGHRVPADPRERLDGVEQDRVGHRRRGVPEDRAAEGDARRTAPRTGPTAHGHRRRTTPPRSSGRRPPGARRWPPARSPGRSRTCRTGRPR